MKRLLVLAAVLLTLAGCSDGRKEATGSASDSAERPVVYTTNYPLM